LVYSLSLAVLAAGMAVGLGVGLGPLAGYSAGGWIDKLASAIGISGVSVPHYWLDIVLVVVFSAERNWLPAMGAASGTPSLTDQLRHMILPAIALAAMPTGIITRSVRALVAKRWGASLYRHWWRADWTTGRCLRMWRGTWPRRRWPCWECRSDI
jgi:peptide/nickel transport system permease protein